MTGVKGKDVLRGGTQSRRDRLDRSANESTVTFRAGETIEDQTDVFLGMDRCGGSSYTSGGPHTHTAVTKNSPASQRIVQNTRSWCNPGLWASLWRDYI